MTLLTYHSKYVVQSGTTVTTTSASLVDDTQASQTFTLDETKTVLVLYVANNALSDSSYDGLTNAINVDGTDKSILKCVSGAFPFTNSNECFWIGSLASGQHTIKGRLAAVWGNGVCVSNRTLLIYILNGTEFTYIDNTTTQTSTSTSYTNDSNATATFTPSGSCKALFLYSVTNDDAATENENGTKISINVGGTDYSEAKQSIPWADAANSVTTVYATSLTATSTTVTGRFACVSSSATVTINRKVFGILLFDSATVLDLVSSTTAASTTSSTFVNDGQASITRNTSGELLVLARATKNDGTTSSTDGQAYGINIDSSDVAHSRTSIGAATAAESILSAYAQTVASASHTINGRLSNNGSGTAAVDTRILIALWFSTGGTEPTTLAMTSTVAGSGSLTATPSLIGIQPCASTISGTGASTANIYEFKRITSSISGTGLFTSNASLNKLITSNISGSGALTANLIRLEPIASTIAGTGLLTSQASLNEIISSTLAGSGATTANIIEFINISSNVSGSGNESASIVLISSSIDLTSSIIGSGAYTANIYELEQITSSISGSGAETATINILKPVTSSVSGSGSQTANIIEFEQIASTLAGTGALTTLASLNKMITSSISGTGLETANPIELIYIVSNVAGNGSETANIILLSSSVDLSSIVSGIGSQTANITELTFISSSVSGSGAETANASLNEIMSSSLAGSGASTSQPILINIVSSSVVGVGSQTANIFEYDYISSNVVGSGDLTANISFGSVGVDLSSTVIGSGSQTANVAVLEYISSLVEGLGLSLANMTIIIPDRIDLEYPLTVSIYQTLRTVVIYQKKWTVTII